MNSLYNFGRRVLLSFANKLMQNTYHSAPVENISLPPMNFHIPGYAKREHVKCYSKGKPLARNKSKRSGGKCAGKSVPVWPLEMDTRNKTTARIQR